jgi:glycosyltransferase involved in cell wall biosynthesis
MAYSSGKKKIAFIKRGPFSHTNMRVNELLASSFPEYDVEVIDLDEEIFLRRKQAVLCNVLHIWRIYGLDLLSGKRTLRECFYRTPFMFRYIKRVIDHKLGGRLGEFVFSIQTQSLYDASVPSLPHFVYTDHTHLANLYYPAFDAALLFARDWIDYEREIYLAATRVFIMSNHVGKSIVEHYGGNPDRITCVYAGSNVETTAAPLQNDNYGNRNILFVGVEWERKGGPLLVAAFRKVREALPDATLTIVGSSPNVEGEGVAVLGRMPLAQVEEHLLRSSVFCMPTKVEPFGIAPIEALVHRIPVVASRIGALPDIVQHGKTGLLVAPDSVDELAAALIDLLSHPEKCRAFGELGHRLVRETYTWEAVGRRMKTQIAADIREANPA